jgi:hypothetical protein
MPGADDGRDADCDTAWLDNAGRRRRRRLVRICFLCSSICFYVNSVLNSRRRRRRPALSSQATSRKAGRVAPVVRPRQLFKPVAVVAAGAARPRIWHSIKPQKICCARASSRALFPDARFLARVLCANSESSKPNTGAGFASSSANVLGLPADTSRYSRNNLGTSSHLPLLATAP